MKSKPLGALFGLLAIVAIVGVAPAFAQTDDVTSQVIGGKIGSSAKASDGSTVTIVTGHPISGQPLAIGIGFKDPTGNFVQHQNYAIAVTQDGNTILSNPTGHTHTGTDTQTTSALSSANPVDIKITLNGIGLPTADPTTWTGVKGETLTFSHVSDVQSTTLTMSDNMTNSSMPAMSNMTTPTPADNSTAAVPEFGSVAPIVLAIAVLSVVVFAAKTRVIPKL